MSLEALFTVGVVILMLGLLVLTSTGPDTVLMGGLTLLLITGIISPQEALSGLSNPGMVTVGVLYIVVAGIRETGSTDMIVRRILGRPRSTADAQFKMMGPVAVISALINDTPVVAIMIPAVIDWAKRFRLQESKLLIPLSYAALLGGTCTLIGTSTNLVVNGLVTAQANLPSLGMFDISWIGLPCAMAGILFVLIAGRWLLPERVPPISCVETPREYTVEMIVDPNGPLANRTVEEAGLRHLPDIFLTEIDRGDHVLAAVSPQEPLEANDRLIFTGLVDAVLDLQRIRGLMPATQEIFKLDVPRSDRLLVEAVVSNRSAVVGRSVRQGRFRSRYNAVVLAVARHGGRLRQNIGDVILRPGDTLLLEAQPSFVEDQRDSFDFFLISPIPDFSPPRHERAYIAIGILAAMVIVVAGQWLSMLHGAMLAAGFMIMTGCVTGAQARRSIDWQVLLTIAASFGIGEALINTGAADFLARYIITTARGDPWTALATVYLITGVFTNLITNNAAVVLIFPIAMATAKDLHVNAMPFIIAIMMGGSASFSTPIGYQTNLMVYTAGGYHFTDFLRIGLPLTLAVGAVVVTLVPMIWGFS